MNGVFISHTHSDHELAAALDQLVSDLFEPNIQVEYSTKKESGGIRFGADWYRWIVQEVESSEISFIVVTPSSIQKPWVIWEAGAVAGAAFASEQKSGKREAHARVLPLVYGVPPSDLPEFFARFQTVTATDKNDIDKLCDELQEQFGDKSGAGWKKYLRSKDAAVARYLTKVGEVLLRLPHMVTEAAIQEWMERLSELQRSRRFSEAVVIESWLDVAFGREENEQRPLDIRIHRRLGELYAMTGDTVKAVRQFELARQLVPRDIFILRRLGKAYLDQNDIEAADRILDRIHVLDKTAFERNPENAALKARSCRAKKDNSGARDVLQTAFNYTPTSYYLGDLLGQAHIALGDTEKAKEVYARVRMLLKELEEENVWTSATALTAAYVLDDEAGVERELETLRELKPTLEQIKTIERGIDDLSRTLGRDDSVRRRLREMEPERADRA